MEAISETLIVECQVCGKQVVLPRPATGHADMDARLVGIARTAVHEGCYDEAMRNQTKIQEDERLESRGTDWNLMCEPFYRDSDKFILSDEAFGKLNLTAVTESMQWQFGAKGLIMHGKKSGTGKTTTAWAILKREFFACRVIVAMSHTELSMKATRMAMSPDLSSVRWVAILKTCDILFIDDLGKSRFKSSNGEGRAAEEFLFDIIDARARALKPIIFTCNMDGKALKDSMSEDRGVGFTRRLRDFYISINFDLNAKK